MIFFLQICGHETRAKSHNMGGWGEIQHHVSFQWTNSVSNGKEANKPEVWKLSIMLCSHIEWFIPGPGNYLHSFRIVGIVNRKKGEKKRCTSGFLNLRKSRFISGYYAAYNAHRSYLNRNLHFDADNWK